MEDILDYEAFGKDAGELKTYKSFGSREEAAAYIDLLKEHNIPYSAESPEQLLDSVIIGEGVLPKVILKIYSGDFMRVNSIIAQQIEQSADDLQAHHLNQLDNEELREILEKPDESSVEAVIIAKLILKNRGIHIDEAEIKSLRDERLRTLRSGKTASQGVLAICFLSIVFGAFLGLMFPVGGIGMGFYYAFDKSTDLDGNKYYTFDAATRKNGQLILWIGLPLMLIFIMWFASK